MSTRNGYAEGGIASLGQPGVLAPMSVPAQPMPTERVPGPDAEISDEALVQIYLAAKAALEGQSANPEQAIQRFIETFGAEAFADLQEEVGDTGESDGLSDSIPATIDGEEPTSLSEGEFVVPADVVSGIGNGDTATGGDRLMDMVNQIRQVRTGSAEPPGQV